MGANSSKLDFSSSEEEDESDDEDWIKSSDDLSDDLIGPDIDPVGDHDDLMTERNRLSIESSDSGVSFKSDWSKDGLIHFKDRVSPRRAHKSVEAFGSSLSLMNDSFIRPRQRSPPRMAHRSVEAFGSGLTLMNDSFIRPRQRSLPRMVLRSVEAFGSGLSLMNDSFIRTGQHSPPREEMNQELSSEVGWKHS